MDDKIQVLRVCYNNNAANMCIIAETKDDITTVYIIDHNITPTETVEVTDEEGNVTTETREVAEPEAGYKYRNQVVTKQAVNDYPHLVRTIKIFKEHIDKTLVAKPTPEVFTPEQIDSAIEEV